MTRLVFLFGAALSLLFSGPAQACRGFFSETYIFLSQVPEEIEEGAIVLRVRPQGSVTAGRNWIQVDVVEVVQGEWDNSVAWIDYGPETSCTRIHLPEEGAYVVGRHSSRSGIMLMGIQYGRNGPLDWPYANEGH